jgi:hypothetical protein
LQVEMALQVEEIMVAVAEAGHQQLVLRAHQSQVMAEMEQHLQFQVLL